MQGLQKLESEQSQAHKELLEEIEADYLGAELSLAHFFKCAWEILEPKTPLKWNWHFDYICEHLEAVERGEILRLFITIPPRNAKSNLVTVTYPVWTWIKNPHLRFMFASYSASLSSKHSLDRRQLIESEWFQMGFGARFALSSDQNVKSEFMNNKRGHMIATSITGTATGKGCNRLIVDDPVNPKEAESETEREQANSSYDATFPSRLDDKKKDAIIIVMQRLHEEDLIGHVKDRDTWAHVDLPAEAQEYQKLIFPVSKIEVIRNKGELLHPDREGPIELAAMRKTLGSRGFSAQYNQRPTAAEGNIIKRWWIKYYRELPGSIEQKGIWADLAYKDGEENDYTVIEVWGRIGPDIYLLEQVRGQFDFPTQLAEFLRVCHAHTDATMKKIEEKANGAALIQMVKEKIPGVVADNPKTSKGARLAAVSPFYESGNVHYPDPELEKNKWVEVNIHELLSMSYAGPKSRNDDTCDVASMAVRDLGEFAASTSRLEALGRA